MSRLDRKNRTSQQLDILNKGGLLDLLDNEIKQLYRINDQEYDAICADITDEDMDILFNFDGEEEITFSGARKILNTLNKYV